MLIRRRAHGKTLVTSRPLLVSAQQSYLRPKETGNAWFQTTTTVWRVDELIRRRVRDWRRLTGEDGHTGARSETFREDHDSAYTSTHSVFPAPLVEWILLRYAPQGGSVLDAFAGGPPRGLVSSVMGHSYTGVEIRQEQIDENQRVLDTLQITGASYVLGDGRYLDALGDQLFDCALTCPPYYDLEVYSDRADDLSNLSSYWEFNASMQFCADAHFERLKPGAFACIVVGPFRNKKIGELIDFPAHTVENFREAGFIYWQQIVLSKNFASAAIRAGNAWKNSKLVPAHEFLLVFRKPE